MRAYYGAFDHAEALVGFETGRNRHLDQHFFFAWHALKRHEQTAGAYVYGGPEFEHSSAVFIGAMDENGKRQIEPLPAA